MKAHKEQGSKEIEDKINSEKMKEQEISNNLKLLKEQLLKEGEIDPANLREISDIKEELYKKYYTPLDTSDKYGPPKTLGENDASWGKTKDLKSGDDVDISLAQCVSVIQDYVASIMFNQCMKKG